MIRSPALKVKPNTIGAASAPSSCGSLARCPQVLQSLHKVTFGLRLSHSQGLLQAGEVDRWVLLLPLVVISLSKTVLRLGDNLFVLVAVLLEGRSIFQTHSFNSQINKMFGSF